MTATLRHRLSLSALTVFLGIASGSLALAQTPPKEDETAPRAASSPHQRETTSTEAKEAPTTDQSDPSSASSPHQRQATKEDTKGTKMAAGKTKAERDRMWSECMKREQQRNTTMSEEQVKKTCMEQMQMHETQAPRQ